MQRTLKTDPISQAPLQELPGLHREALDVSGQILCHTFTVFGVLFESQKVPSATLN